MIRGTKLSLVVASLAIAVGAISGVGAISPAGATAQSIDDVLSGCRVVAVYHGQGWSSYKIRCRNGTVHWSNSPTL